MPMHTNCYPSVLEIGCACGVTLSSKVTLLARNRVMGGVRPTSEHARGES